MIEAVLRGMTLEQRLTDDKPLETRQEMDKFLSSVERRAFYIARLGVGHTEEALDLVQDAMMKLAQRYSTHPAHEWRALFFKILESRIMDWHRRQKVRNRWRVWLDKIGLDKQTDKQTLSGEEKGDELCQFADQHARQPWQHLQDQQSMNNLSNALEQLPVRQQQAFLLRAWEGMSVEETAVAMGCSGGSVKTHYSRAIHKLRDVLKEYAP